MCEVDDGLRLTVLAERKFKPGQADCPIAEIENRNEIIKAKLYMLVNYEQV